MSVMKSFLALTVVMCSLTLTTATFRLKSKGRTTTLVQPISKYRSVQYLAPLVVPEPVPAPAVYIPPVPTGIATFSAPPPPPAAFIAPPPPPPPPAAFVAPPPPPPPAFIASPPPPAAFVAQLPPPPVVPIPVASYSAPVPPPPPVPVYGTPFLTYGPPSPGYSDSVVVFDEPAGISQQYWRDDKTVEEEYKR